MNCCLCDDRTNDIKWCPACNHSFCKSCRASYFHRGVAALKEWMLSKPPAFCDHPVE